MLTERLKGRNNGDKKLMGGWQGWRWKIKIDYLYLDFGVIQLHLFVKNKVVH
jgi:hypothetical protein